MGAIHPTKEELKSRAQLEQSIIPPRDKSLSPQPNTASMTVFLHLYQ